MFLVPGSRDTILSNDPEDALEDHEEDAETETIILQEEERSLDITLIPPKS